MKKKLSSEQEVLPIIPLRDVVIYPHMVVPLFIARPKSIKALVSAMNSGKQVFLISQRQSKINDPEIADLFSLGTVGNILQFLRLPDNTIKVLVEGVYRGFMSDHFEQDEITLATIEKVAEPWKPGRETEAMIRTALKIFEQYVRANPKMPEELLAALADIKDPGRLADTIAMHLPLQYQVKQKILETLNAKSRLEMILEVLESELDMLKIEDTIQTKVKQQMEKGQREYYLHEKIKAIKKELGEDGEKEFTDFEKTEKRIKDAGMTKEAEAKALSELKKLKMMPPMSAESTVSRGYLDWLLDLPWQARSKINKDLNRAEDILEEDHYGLKKIKERITEYLAVQQRAGKVKGPILCFVGPPGVGKTSLGKSIARATGREFVRIALGGVRDEAEIRGHRRTYIGSMPGKILQKMAKVKVRNPLFMLDEVDKMSMDFRGDPSAALLEVLDPEQNGTFSDHYLEVEYDLSDVMFVCTANSLDIPDPLLDRMEVLRLEGYTEDEKLHIAAKYLIPKQINESGLKTNEIAISDSVVRDIIRYYTREAGVRSLERALAKICRKVVKSILLNHKKKHKVLITEKNLEEFLGVKPFRFGLAEKNDQVGQVTGLAWTEVGGDLLTIEAAIMPGKGNSTYTGSLGDVMLESIQAAITVVRTRTDKLGIPANFYSKNDIHVHVPEGSTPKDGPSAGISMCTALISALTKIPVRADVAMTGEITLRGEVLPIGGLKEKLLAALRGGIKTVIIPADNKKDLKEMPENITKKLNIKPVKWIDEVLEVALERMPKEAKNNAKK